MNKIAEIRKIIIQYIASGNIDPNNEGEVEKFSELLRTLYITEST